MNQQTQVLQKMQELFKLANEGMNRADFQQAFSNVVALITKINKEMIKRNDDSFSQITAQFKALEKEVKAASKDDFGTLKTDLVSKVNTALKEQTNGMKFIYDKVNSLEEREDGKDGHTPTNDELIALIKPLIPEAIPGKNAEIDMEKLVKDVSEKMPRQVQTPAKAYKVWLKDFSASCDGSNKTFNFGTHFGVVGVYSTEFPLIYRPGIDYTETAKGFVLTAAVNAPASGQTLTAQFLK